jgi:hypothetical protein
MRLSPLHLSLPKLVMNGVLFKSKKPEISAGEHAGDEGLSLRIEERYF